MQVAQQGPDLGLYTQPNMTFIVPADAQSGWHDVCIELRRTRDQYVVWKVCTKFFVIRLETIEDAYKLIIIIKLQLASLMPKGSAQSIEAKLDAVIGMMSQGNFDTAANQLDAVIQELEAMLGKTIGKTYMEWSQVKRKIELAYMLYDFLKFKATKEFPRPCICHWVSSITTTYHGPVFLQESQYGWLQIIGLGTTIDLEGNMFVSGTKSDNISGERSVGTYVTVKRVIKCPECEPNIFLSGSMEGKVKARFEDYPLTGVGTGRATSGARGEATNDLVYVDEKALISTDKETGISVSYKNISMVITKGEGSFTEPLGASKERTITEDFAQVYLESFAAATMKGDGQNFGFAFLEVEGAVEHHLTIEATCKPKKPEHVCIGSLAIKLRRIIADTTYADFIGKSYSAPSHWLAGDKREPTEWIDPE